MAKSLILVVTLFLLEQVTFGSLANYFCIEI